MLFKIIDTFCNNLIGVGLATLFVPYLNSSIPLWAIILIGLFIGSIIEFIISNF